MSTYIINPNGTLEWSMPVTALNQTGAQSQASPPRKSRH
jgi:hypothetical protein